METLERMKLSLQMEIGVLEKDLAQLRATGASPTNPLMVHLKGEIAGINVALGMVVEMIEENKKQQGER